jgi:broad specificity phosphatase PhoE
MNKHFMLRTDPKESKEKLVTSFEDPEKEWSFAPRFLSMDEELLLHAKDSKETSFLHAKDAKAELKDPKAELLLAKDPEEELSFTPRFLSMEEEALLHAKDPKAELMHAKDPVLHAKEEVVFDVDTIDPEEEMSYTAFPSVLEDTLRARGSTIFARDAAVSESDPMPEPVFADCNYDTLSAAIRGDESRTWTETGSGASLHFDGNKKVLYFVKAGLSKNLKRLGEYARFQYAANRGIYRVKDKGSVGSNHAMAFLARRDGKLTVLYRNVVYTFSRSDKQVIFVRHGDSVHNTWKDFEERRNGPGIRRTDANANFTDVTDDNRTDAPLTEHLKMEGIRKFAETKWDMLGYGETQAGLEDHIKNNVRIHVSPHTRTLQTLILAFYDVPGMQHATIVVDPRIREVRVGDAKDCIGNDADHMISKINTEFFQLASWHRYNHQNIGQLREKINFKFLHKLVAAIETARDAGKINTSFLTRWYGWAETEDARGTIFAGQWGIFQEIQSYPQSRVILFGHSAIFRAALNKIYGYSKTPAYYKTDKMINYGHLKINYASGYGLIPTNQYTVFKVAARLQAMKDAGEDPAADVARIARGDWSSKILDPTLRKLYAGGNVTKGQIYEVFAHLN